MSLGDFASPNMVANIVTNERDIRNLFQYISQRVQPIFAEYRKYTNKHIKYIVFP